MAPLDFEAPAPAGRAVRAGRRRPQATELQVLMLKGLPAAGKDTYAENLMADQENWVRVNTAMLGEMLHHGAGSPAHTRFTLRVRDELVRAAMRRGHNVVVTDTNLHPHHEAALRQLVAEFNAEAKASGNLYAATYVFRAEDLGTSVEDCIARDLQRPRSVGEREIRRLYRRFIAPKVERRDPTHNFDLPNAMLCDLDGALYTPGETGTLRVPVLATIERFCGPDITPDKRLLLVLCTGRTDRAATLATLAQDHIAFDMLVTRQPGDTRDAAVVTHELYRYYIEPLYNITLVLEDRADVVRMWRETVGLPCFAVADGDL